MKKVNIEDNAAQILAANPNIKEVFMTSDGQGFTSESVAFNHQKTIDASVEVESFKREAAPASEGGSIVDLSIAKLTEAIKDEVNVVVLKDLLAAETAKGNDKRKGALDAIQERIDAVTNDNQDQ